MKVLHISPGKLYGGVETLLVTLARYRHLCPAMEPEFAICFEGRLAEELRGLDAPVHPMGEVRMSRPQTVLRARRRMKSLLRSRSFDVVICHMAWPLVVFGVTIAAAHLPMVFWLHGATTGRHWLGRWARMRKPDLAIAPSRFTADTLPAMFPGLRGQVINYAVAAPDQSLRGDRAAVRSELETGSDSVVIIQASRLEEWKEQMVHLEALGNLRDLNEWSCWIVGGPQRQHEASYLAALKEFASRLGIVDRVRFAGQRADVPRLLAAADIYCQPNTGLEGLPIVFAEALYAALPIVSSNLGGFWEAVDDSCGALVPAGDSSALANALRRLIVDKDLRHKLGASGPPRAWAMFEPGRQTKKLFDALSSVVRPSPAEIQTLHSI